MKALGAPDVAARFRIERDLVTFRIDGSAAGEHDGAKGVVVLLLLEGGTESRKRPRWHRSEGGKGR